MNTSWIKSCHDYISLNDDYSDMLTEHFKVNSYDQQSNFIPIYTQTELKYYLRFVLVAAASEASSSDWQLPQTSSQRPSRHQRSVSPTPSSSSSYTTHDITRTNLRDVTWSRDVKWVLRAVLTWASSTCCSPSNPRVSHNWGPCVGGCACRTLYLPYQTAGSGPSDRPFTGLLALQNVPQIWGFGSGTARWYVLWDRYLIKSFIK